MATYEDLEKRLIDSATKGKFIEEEEKIKNSGNKKEEALLEEILNPKNYPPVVKTKDCGNGGECHQKCEVSCLFDAIKRDESGKLKINGDCAGCGKCIEACESGALSERSDLVPLIKILVEKKVPVYAMIAPAFSGQFSEDVTSGKLRTAFKRLGFYGMIEVALFADILTMKEALEFERSIHTDKDFVLTSCCCPMWVALIRKQYHKLVSHVPPSVSPMAACGRAIKKIHPDAMTVFIGPCLAKKAEAREPDIRPDVDYVLNFKEIGELFDIANIDPSDLPEETREHSSKAGRIYARAGGVSEAVKTTLERINPEFSIGLTSECANGIIECKKMLAKVAAGEIHANFIEGMGCVGGCVGGPKRIIPMEEGTHHVNHYGDNAKSTTPVDNPCVLDILKRLGFDTLESLLDRDSTFIRNFNDAPKTNALKSDKTIEDASKGKKDEKLE